MKHAASGLLASAYISQTSARRLSAALKCFGYAALVVCAMFAAVPVTMAQNIEFTQGSSGSTTMTLQMPLRAYPGRGTASLPITLYYSSKVWGIGYNKSVRLNNTLRNAVAEAVYAEHSTAGWTTSLDVPKVEWPRLNDRYWYDGKTYFASFQPYTQRVSNVFIHMPDGSTHELRKSDQVYQDTGTIDTSGTFYAVDGSRLRYDSTGQSTGTLYMPDGSRYVLNGATVQFVERNGNTLNYNVAARQWTDTLGRVIGTPWPANPQAGDYSYALPGLGGTTTYTLKWRNLSTVLTPNEQGQTPTLKAMSSHHLPNPALPATDQNGTNFPQPSGLPSLYFSDYGDPSADNPETTFTYVVGRGQAAGQVFNPVVLAEIALPDGTSYKFSYNIYGEIEKVIYPTGGYQRYQYDIVKPFGRSAPPYNQASRGTVSRWVSPKGTGGADESRWQYQVSTPSTGAYMVRVIAPDNTRTDTYMHNFFGSVNNFGYQDARNGRTYDEQAYDAGGVMLRRTLTEWVQTSATYAKPRPTSSTPATGNYTAYRNPRAAKSVKLILDTGGDALASTALYGYDTTYQFSTGVELTSTGEYNYEFVELATARDGQIASMPLGALARTVETSYLTGNAAYRGRNLLGLLASEVVKDAWGNVVAKKEILYDESSYPLLPPYANINGWTDPLTAARGNATTIRRYADILLGIYLETHTQYDQCGNVRHSWDAHEPSAPNHGHLSQIEYSSTYQYAYPTRALTPAPDPSGANGYAAAMEARSAYDFTSGLLTSTTDANGQITSFSYADDAGVLDPLFRLRKVTRPTGGGWTKYNYGIFNNAGFDNRYVETINALDASRSTFSYQFYDGLGRPNRTFIYVGPGAYDTVDTQYDTMGRVWRASQPYRTTGAPDPIPAAAKWTTTAYDALGRVRFLTTTDGAQVETIYAGNEVTVKDQAGRRRLSRTDALGRTTTVVEDPLGAAHQTDYTYDVLGNLRMVEQGVQRRYYMFDALSRPLRVKNPEQDANPQVGGTDPLTGNAQWSISYSYDLNGNLRTRTDARNVTATFTYDNLKRQIRTQYTDATPTVEQFYDTFWKGQPWKLSSGNDISEFGNYDAMGRPRLRRQWFSDGYTWRYYNVTCTYDLAGNVTSQTYPSGHTTSYQYDVAGRVNDFRGTLGDGVSRVYSTGLTYDEAGRMKQEQFGTQTPVYNKSYYNSRGQLAEIRVGTTPNDSGWNRGAIINHYSGAPGSWGAGGGGPDNDGNLKAQDVYIPNDDQISGYAVNTQYYEYDSLSRLHRVREPGGGGPDRVQDYDFDRYGNRTVNMAVSQGFGVNNKAFEVEESTNRLLVPAGQPGAMTYDAAGNLTGDTYSGSGVSRAYDAEGRMTRETTYNSVVAGRYVYDGGGRRVRRNAAGQEWWYVYGLGGELVAEYGSNFPGVAQQEYGYRGGELLVTASGYAGQGLQADYFNSLDFTNPALTRADPSVNFEWHSASPGAGVNADVFTARWTGYVTPRYTETYTFYTQSDDGVRLWVNGQLLVDKWIDQGWTEWSGQITLEAGKRYEIRMEFYERYWGAIAKLFWSSASQSKEIVPASQLTPPQGAAVKWLVNDQLGTPRMVLDQTGSLGRMARHDYLPFGEEVGAGVGARNYQQGYVSDGTRQQFTGHERDYETRLDFMQARYYSGSQGRFTTPDSVAGSKANPQSLNLYAYVLNNPQRYTDPTGHMPASVGWSGAADGFWGGSVFDQDPRFGGMGITSERMAERDRAFSDAIKAKRINDQIEKGELTRAEVEEMIKGNDNLSIEEVTVKVIEEEPEPQSTARQSPASCDVQLPGDEQSKAVIATILGEATSAANIGGREYKDGDAVGKPSGREITLYTISVESLLMTAVVINRFRDEDRYTSWKDVVSAPKQFLAYNDGSKLNAADYGTKGSIECQRLGAILIGFNAAPGMVSAFKELQVIKNWRGIVQENKQGNLFIREQGGAHRVGRTDFY